MQDHGLMSGTGATLLQNYLPVVVVVPLLAILTSGFVVVRPSVATRVVNSQRWGLSAAITCRIISPTWLHAPFCNANLLRAMSAVVLATVYTHCIFARTVCCV